MRGPFWGCPHLTTMLVFGVDRKYLGLLFNRSPMKGGQGPSFSGHQHNLHIFIRCGLVGCMYSDEAFHKRVPMETPNREPQEYSRNIIEYKDPGKDIPFIFLLYSWGPVLYSWGPVIGVPK